MSTARSVVAKHWFLLMVGPVVTAAVLAPDWGATLPRYHITDIGVVLAMFIGSLKLDRSSFLGALRRLPLMAVSLVLVFVVSPLASLGLASLLGLGGSDDILAVLLCSAGASTLATAIVLTEVAGGDVALAIILTVVNNVASVIATPLAFRLVAHNDVALDHVSMGLELSLKVILPVVVGQIARQWLNQWAVRHNKALSTTAQMVILMFVFSGVSAAAPRLESATKLIWVAVLVAGLHGAMLILSGLAGRLFTRSPQSRVALTLVSSQKTLPAAMVIWKSHLSSVPLGPLVVVMYHLVQIIVDSVLATTLLRVHEQRVETGENS